MRVRVWALCVSSIVVMAACGRIESAVAPTSAPASDMPTSTLAAPTTAAGSMPAFAASSRPVATVGSVTDTAQTSTIPVVTVGSVTDTAQTSTTPVATAGSVTDTAQTGPTTGGIVVATIAATAGAAVSGTLLTRSGEITHVDEHSMTLNDTPEPIALTQATTILALNKLPPRSSLAVGRYAIVQARRLSSGELLAQQIMLAPNIP